jgi:hypothetical protein
MQAITARARIVGTLLIAFLGFCGSALAQNVKVRIELIDLHCNHDKNTEDILGADEFYVTSKLVSGPVSKDVITKPFDINTDQTKPFPDDQKVLFESSVPANSKIVGGMVAWDEDYAKDWEKKDKAIAEKVAAVVSGGAGTVAGPEAGPIVAGIVQAVKEVGGLLAQSDKDDNLGELKLEIPANGPPEEVKEWKFEHSDGIGYSDWSYVLRYRIVRQK